MSSSIVNRKNILAGVFVVASLVLAVAIAVVLGDVLGGLGSKHEYTVRFPTSVGVTGLQPGSEVTFAGMPVGQVVSITPHQPDGPAVPARSIDVVIAVDSRFTLHEDAFADLAPPILGGVSRINFASAGAGAITPGDRLAELAQSNNNAVLEPGEAVRGRFAPSILAQLGFTVEDAERLRNTIADVETIAGTARQTVARVDRMAETLEPRFDTAVNDAQTAVANARALTERFTADGDWAARVTSILANADQTIAAGPAVAEDARSAIASARELMDTHTETIGRILANAETTTRRVNDRTMDQAEAMIREGTLALASFRAVGDQSGAMLTALRPDIAASAANARSITQQGRLFLDEVRAQPWRLLKQPDKADLMREPIYAAARSYADAVSDLRAASEALEAALQSAGADARNIRAETPEQVARIAATVQSAYDRYADAERALLETLRNTGP
jgi:phospholipid/cholesterol/gamma-HCH transport system substrate-binding protein